MLHNKQYNAVVYSSDKEYSCKTQDAYRIRDILEGYIDIIRRRMLAKPSADPGDSMAIYHDNIQTGQWVILKHFSFIGIWTYPALNWPYSQGDICQPDPDYVVPRASLAGLPAKERKGDMEISK